MNTLDIITDFLRHIGLTVYFEPLDMPTFLPGLYIRKGALIIDREKLLYPGDVLHEAGHLAVMPPQIRQEMEDNLGMQEIHQGGELGAIAWSYAACLHLGFPPELVFHDAGYRGSSESIIRALSNGDTMGIPLLTWQEMTENNTPEALYPYPKMKSWLCMVNKYEVAE